uniref:Uncharacterized protein n=1 Tax=Chromera velia CCMP2878 TaxID=1169474 RepID=A0A0G4I8P2_9ALVE|eukprot:Cvel_11916.t1-p1 / transcript=Cvel_11916.t1 / gene=Cvel_11916 / organism=Chromera_velia_CCMP2878 / gene_product=hypothetical protein / transcript_product=hypothetical protein / location=Cvel_scaffold763:17990-19336(-) / protein_length=449 / sequence_SO=supercontig / SO=protein_coding / is_pseudo=false
MRANVESSIAPHMPFDGDDGAVAKFRHFAQPSCFSRLPANPSVPAQTHGVQLTGCSSTVHPRPHATRPSRKRRHCEHKTHRPKECLKQHYCSDCDHWGHKTGDCDLAHDHFALLRGYGYSKSGGRSGGNGGGQGKRGRKFTGSEKGRAHQQGGALTGETNESEASDTDLEAFLAAAAVRHLSQSAFSLPVSSGFSFDGFACLLDLGVSGTTCTHGWLNKHAEESGLQWTETDLPTPLSVVPACRTKVRMRHRATIPCKLNGQLAVLKPSIMETEAVTLPLIGNQRLIKLGVRFDYRTRSLELPSTVINFLRTANDLFFLPLEIDETSPPESPPALNSPSVSPAAVAVDPASPVSPPLSPSLVVLTNGHLSARLKAAKQKKQHRGNRTQSHVVKTHLGESAVSPPVSSSCDSSSASDQPLSQQPKSFFSQDPPPISIKATVDELIRTHHE